MLPGDVELEAVRVADREHAGSPGHVPGLPIEHAAACLDLRRESVDVLDRAEPQPQAFALLAVAALREIVLVQHDRGAAGEELDSHQLAAVLPAVMQRE